jgi:hypothetical protein
MEGNIGRYPKGLVAASLATSNGSTPNGTQASAISLAYAIVIVLWQFSYNFTISATSGLLTGTTVSKIDSYSPVIASSDAGTTSSSAD